MDLKFSDFLNLINDRDSDDVKKIINFNKLLAIKIGSQQEFRKTPRATCGMFFGWLVENYTQVTVFECFNQIKGNINASITENPNRTSNGTEVSFLKIGNTGFYLNLTYAYPLEYMELCARCLKELDSDKTEAVFFEIETKDFNHEENMIGMKEDNNMQDGMKELFVKGRCRQIIFTGAPGTGKTYRVRKYVEEQCTEQLKLENGRKIDQYKFVQFHSSYDYSDFVEGLRPVEFNDKNTFVRVDGIFKAFCRGIVEYNLERLRKSDFAIDNMNDLYTACHIKNGESQEKKNKIKDIIEQKQFYFVIDEINRADLGKVFGELMFGLEESYRGVENRFDTQYTNLRTFNIEQNGYYNGEGDVFKHGFFIPENLYIVGTMNDIDRSVESFDFALRRRFQWKEIKAKEVMKSTLEAIFEKRTKEEEKVKDSSYLLAKIEALNEKISTEGAPFGLTSAYHIGPAYFKEYGLMEADTVVTEQVIWNRRVEPILKEYVRGRDSAKVATFIRNCAKVFGVNTSYEYEEI
ncbi:MAG: ATPase associated with various cellular 5 [Herbinix sp.]|jgi:phage terminase small subunit|nr:ATPase associated with various cellular 5 [Herbinix sp.]